MTGELLSEKTANVGDKPIRIWLTGLDNESQQAAFYYIWKNNLPLATKTLSYEKNRTKDSLVKVGVLTDLNDYQLRIENGKIGPKYNLLFWDMDEDIGIWLSPQILSKEFKKEQDYINKYLDFINGGNINLIKILLR